MPRSGSPAVPTPISTCSSRHSSPKAASWWPGQGLADSEAIYSYEGTREINTLIVGRAITGLSAFVQG